jgi:putative flippase GtrA
MTTSRGKAHRGWRELPRWAQQFARYSVVGLVNLGVFYGVFNLLLTLRWPTLVAYVLSLFIAFINSFLLNKFWAFRATGRERLANQLALFLLITLVTMGVGSAAVYLLLIPLAKYGRLGRNLAALLASPPTVVWNFIAYRRWAFARDDQVEGSPKFLEK